MAELRGGRDGWYNLPNVDGQRTVLTSMGRRTLIISSYQTLMSMIARHVHIAGARVSEKKLHPTSTDLSRGIRWPTSSMSISTLGLRRYSVVESNDCLGELVSFRAVPGAD